MLFEKKRQLESESAAGGVQHSIFKPESRLQFYVPFPKKTLRKAVKLDGMVSVQISYPLFY